jgi:hypothetical protein
MEFYLKFQRIHPEDIVGKRSFDMLRPFWMMKMKEKNVYCCIYHVEIQELLVALNNMRAKSDLVQLCVIVTARYVIPMNADVWPSFVPILEPPPFGSRFCAHVKSFWSDTTMLVFSVSVSIVELRHY